MTDLPAYHSSQRLDLGQGQCRRVREHQPPDRRAHTREGASRRAPPAAALFARHAERRQGHRAARGAPRDRARGRRVRRLAHQDHGRRSVRQRLRPGKPQLEDPGAHGPEWGGSGSCVRIGRDPPSTSLRSSARSCPGTTRRAPSACRGSSGRWAPRRTSVAASAISMRMRRPRSEYAINRFAMEVKRELDVLDRRLGETQISREVSTRLPTWPCGRGTARS